MWRVWVLPRLVQRAGRSAAPRGLVHQVQSRQGEWGHAWAPWGHLGLADRAGPAGLCPAPQPSAMTSCNRSPNPAVRHAQDHTLTTGWAASQSRPLPRRGPAGAIRLPSAAKEETGGGGHSPRGGCPGAGRQGSRGGPSPGVTPFMATSKGPSIQKLGTGQETWPSLYENQASGMCFHL